MDHGGGRDRECENPIARPNRLAAAVRECLSGLGETFVDLLARTSRHFGNSGPSARAGTIARSDPSGFWSPNSQPNSLSIYFPTPLLDGNDRVVCVDSAAARQPWNLRSDFLHGYRAHPRDRDSSRSRLTAAD